MLPLGEKKKKLKKILKFKGKGNKWSIKAEKRKAGWRADFPLSCPSSAEGKLAKPNRRGGEKR